MTEWERFGTEKYKNKILIGLQSIASLPDGIFTGNLAKGYDPATGRISYDGDPSVRSTNHLMTIMGGFEVMNTSHVVISRWPGISVIVISLSADWRLMQLGMIVTLSEQQLHGTHYGSMVTTHPTPTMPPSGVSMPYICKRFF